MNRTVSNIIIFAFIGLLVGSFTFCVVKISTITISEMYQVHEETTAETSEPIKEPDPKPESVPAAPTYYEPFEMEKVGASTDGRYVFYRETTTDVLYLSWKNMNAGGMTVMLDPETGLPLTYTKYMELYDRAYQNGTLVPVA